MGYISEILITPIFIIGIPLLIGYFGLKYLKALICFNIVLLVLLVIASGAFAYKPGLIQVGLMLLLFYLLTIIIINSISIFVSESFIPLGISVLCVILIAFSNRIGYRLRLYVFEQRLPQYEEAVRMMESNISDEPVLLMGEAIPERYRHLAYRIHAQKDDRGVFIVDFLWGSAFPLKHTGFVYLSDGKLPGKRSDFRRYWPHACQINEHWFTVSD